MLTDEHCHYVMLAVIACIVLVFGLLLFRKREENVHPNTVVVNTREQCDNAISILMGRSQCRVLGFDCEWVTSNGSRHPVALLQLASHDGFCVLFRLCKIQCVPKKLKDILEDPFILKVGVSPINDAHYLSCDYGVNVSSFLDLRYLAVEASEEPGGLYSLAKTHLNHMLDKNSNVSYSNWETNILTHNQILYASEDARVGVQIFSKLIDKIMISKNGSKWLWKTMDEKWSDVEAVCDNYVNARFLDRQWTNKNNITLNQKIYTLKKFIGDQHNNWYFMVIYFSNNIIGEDHTREDRQRLQFRKKAKSQKFQMYSAMKIFNEMPEDIRKEEKLHRFEMKLKGQLCDQ